MIKERQVNIIHMTLLEVSGSGQDVSVCILVEHPSDSTTIKDVFCNFDLTYLHVVFIQPPPTPDIPCDDNR
jgi:hypothetical protein